jgi:hypothetical protein
MALVDKPSLLRDPCERLVGAVLTRASRRCMKQRCGPTSAAFLKERLER